jgi:hypothetical protein
MQPERPHHGIMEASFGLFKGLLKILDRKGTTFHKKSQHQRMIQENTSFAHLMGIAFDAVFIVLEDQSIEEPVPLPATEDRCLAQDSGVVADTEEPERRSEEHKLNGQEIMSICRHLAYMKLLDFNTVGSGGAIGLNLHVDPSNRQIPSALDSSSHPLTIKDVDQKTRRGCTYAHNLRPP